MGLSFSGKSGRNRWKTENETYRRSGGNVGIIPVSSVGDPAILGSGGSERKDIFFYGIISLLAKRYCFCYNCICSRLAGSQADASGGYIDSLIFGKIPLLH